MPLNKLDWKKNNKLFILAFGRERQNVFIMFTLRLELQPSEVSCYVLQTFIWNVLLEINIVARENNIITLKAQLLLNMKRKYWTDTYIKTFHCHCLFCSLIYMCCNQTTPISEKIIQIEEHTWLWTVQCTFFFHIVSLHLDTNVTILKTFE